jgi:hypothetical protein
MAQRMASASDPEMFERIRPLPLMASATSCS